MKKIVFFVVVTLFSSLTFGQGMPTLYEKEGLTAASVAANDTSGVLGKKSLKFSISTDQVVERRFGRWDLKLSPRNFSAGAILYGNVMIPSASGDLNVSISLLKDTNVVLNSTIPLVSYGAWHREAFQFPIVGIDSITGIRISISFPQNAPIGTRSIFLDGISYSINNAEVVWNDCSGSGDTTKPGITSLVAPVNGVINISAQPIFSWNSTLSTTQYQLQILKKDGSIVYDQKVQTTTVTLLSALDFNTQYDWRVKCWNGNTPSDNWSETFSFTTATQIVSVPIFTSPVSGGKYQNSVTVNWSGGDAELQLMDMSGVTIQNPSPVSSPYISIGMASGEYQLRGRFVNPRSDWSSTIIFTVESFIVIHDTPSLIFPLNDATGLSVDPMLQWNAVSVPGVKYEVILGISSDLLNPLYEIKVNSLQFRVTGLSYSTTYYWKARAVLGTSVGPWSSVSNFMTSGITDVSDTSIPTEFNLSQNYPNPFNPVTTITYQLPESGNVSLKVFDILGNEVQTLVNEQKEVGSYTVQFDASSFASGMYVYRLQVNDYLSTRKMILTK